MATNIELTLSVCVSDLVSVAHTKEYIKIYVNVA